MIFKHILKQLMIQGHQADEDIVYFNDRYLNEQLTVMLNELNVLLLILKLLMPVNS